LEAARGVRDPEKLVPILTTLAIAQSQGRDREGARATFDEALSVVQSEEERGRSLDDVSWKYQGGSAAADKLRIARGLAKAGFGDHAVQVSSNIEVAESLAESGDVANLKQLLIPAAHNSYSSYRMCRLLARVYPEHATAIARKALELLDRIVAA